MKTLSQEKIIEIRNSVNIVDVVSNYISLTKRGKNYFGVCPFHEDKNPSMSINENRGIAKCFACGTGGNAISFIQKYESEINHNEITIERIHFSVSEPTDITFTIDQSSYQGDYLIISKLDRGVTNSTSTGSSSPNYAHWRGKTTGSTSMTVSDTEEHYVELMYRKDDTTSRGRDNVIVTLSIPNGCTTYDVTSEYEVWRETNCDGFTGNVRYSNPKKSYKCNWVTYQWREEEITCGGSLPENTTEVNEAPELNTDF